MAGKATRPGVRLRTRNAIIAALTLPIIWAAIQYNRYAYAIGWHCLHGNYAQVGSYRVRVPLLWWGQRDSTHYKSYLLLRAFPFNTRLQTRLTVRSTLPVDVPKTDQEASELVQTLIASKDAKATAGTSSSMVILRAKHFSLYCEKLEFTPFAIPLNTSLFCSAAGVPYTWNYFGPSSNEREAELVLSTLE